MAREWRAEKIIAEVYVRSGCGVVDVDTVVDMRRKSFLRHWRTGTFHTFQ